MRPRVTSVGLIMPPRAENFVYPAHIERASLDALPTGPGVYLFLDRRGGPLYIGKSVNIRTRILSHLRTPEESAMLNESRRVDFMRTAGEIGALLLESHLVKKWQPLYNAQLRQIGAAFAFFLARGEVCPCVVSSDEIDFGDGTGIYGFFPSRRAAQDGLQALARKYGLCPALLGLESAIKGRGCFAHQLGRCRGACIGRETHRAHLARLRRALKELQASVWPFEGRIGIVEELGKLRQTHVIDRWCYLGTLEGRRRKLALAVKHFIDVDTYKILSGPMSLGKLHVVPMHDHA